ncbi:MAG: DUF192 domain-containing protein [Bdellovibrionota bacterium]
MKANVKYKETTLIENAQVADGFWLKLTGYMFRKTPHVPGILFATNSIQTTFMHFQLDLVFIDKQNRVVKVVRNIKPWRFTPFYFKAKWTLELPVGHIPAELSEGDTLEVTFV